MGVILFLRLHVCRRSMGISRLGHILALGAKGHLVIHSVVLLCRRNACLLCKGMERQGAGNSYCYRIFCGAVYISWGESLNEEQPQLLGQTQSLDRILQGQALAKYFVPLSGASKPSQ